MHAENLRSIAASQRHEGQYMENMRPPDAAKYLGISESLLAKLRMRATRRNGPNFIKISGCIVYRKADLDDWLERNSVRIDS